MDGFLVDTEQIQRPPEMSPPAVHEAPVSGACPTGTQAKRDRDLPEGALPDPAPSRNPGPAGTPRATLSPKEQLFPD